MGDEMNTSGVTEKPVLIGGVLVDEYGVDLLATPRPADPAGIKARAYLRRRFLKGPVSWPWLCKASSAGTGRSPLAVALCLCYLAGRVGSDTVKLGHKSLDEAGLSRQAAYRGLSALEAVGIVTVERVPGRAPLVTLHGWKHDCRKH